MWLSKQACPANAQQPVTVESKVAAVTWGFWPTSRFPPPLIEPDVRRPLDILVRKQAAGRFFVCHLQKAAAKSLTQKFLAQVLVAWFTDSEASEG